MSKEANGARRVFLLLFCGIAVMVSSLWAGSGETAWLQRRWRVAVSRRVREAPGNVDAVAHIRERGIARLRR